MTVSMEGSGMDFGPLEAALRDAYLASADGPVRGDADLNPGMRPTRADLIDAAVLVPLVSRGREPSVLLTRRTAHLKAHAGQIAFPGGRRDPGDVDAVATALRETEEEVGIPPSRVRVIGRLARYVTRTGFAVTPVVGIVSPPIAPRPEPGEVDEVFEVPLAFLVDRANHQRHSRDVAGVRRSFYAMPYGDYYIWGATAGMIVNLVDVLDGAMKEAMGR
jgi:8-oxo-dGTP pyrophosphatase MutT (NUDIX family)